MFALPGGGTFGGAIPAAAGVATPFTVSAGASTGATVMMIAGNGGGSGAPAETFDTLEDATGQMEKLECIEKVKTKGDLKDFGFTEKWTGQNPTTGEWHSAFFNPKTGKFTGGHMSSRNW